MAAAPGAGPWREGADPQGMAAAQHRLGGATRFGPGATARLQEMGRRLALSLRSVARCGRVARTIAALDGLTVTEARHVDEALEFRLEAALRADDPG